MKKKILSFFAVCLLTAVAVTCCLIIADADETYIDLTTLTPQNVHVGWGNLAVNKGLDGKELDMANDRGGVTVYEKGFTAHADSSMEFDISKLAGVQMFTAFVGAEHAESNATPSSTSVKFLVYADGVKLFESGVLGYNDPAQEIFVQIPAGTKILKLVTDGDGSNTGDHSAWGSPRLLTDASILEKFKEIRLTSDKNVYKTGESVQLKASFLNMSGKELVPDSVKYSSSDTSVATVSSKGLVTSKREGLVRLTVTAVKGDITLSKTVAVTFMNKIETKTFSVVSPSGNLKMEILLDEQGMISYKVADKSALSVLGQSYIGINTEFCDFSNALIFVDREENEVDETYKNISGKKSTVRNHYKETVLSFKKDVYFFDVYVRMYDDGFAYRFGVRRADGKEEKLNVVGETGTFAISPASKVSAEFISSLTSTFCYESGYSTRTVEDLSASSYTCFPATFILYDGDTRTNKHLLLSEADYFGDSYVGMVLTTKEKGVFGMTVAPKVSMNDKVEITTSFVSPWRYGIYGELKDIVESDMTENLSTAPEGDFSWVEPGVTAWMWLSEGFSGQRNEKTIREYIDLASDMGWKYLILDEGWQPESKVAGKKYDGYFNYFDKLLEYAESKGVGFIVWVKYCDLDTPEERQVLVEWAKKGIKGIKADFFDSEDQETLKGFKAIYEICAENHMIVNCHGASKPTGERRTYPNVINREAVNGEEYGGFWMSGATYWAYARNVVGPVDITPRLYSTASAGNTTVAQMACNVIFESGMPCMASDTLEYLNFNCNSFYKNLPAAWDDIHFIDGGIGTWVSLARRSGNNWYAATITNSERKNLEMSLDFLGEGTYYAIIYSDISRTEVAMSCRAVTKKDTLTYSVQSKGGYIVKFVNAEEAKKILPSAIVPEKAELTVYTGFRNVLNYKLEGENIQIPEVVFTSSNTEVASVSGKGLITGVKEGVTTITVSSLADPSIKSEVTVTVKKSPVKLTSSFIIKNEGTNPGLKPTPVLEDLTKVNVIANPGKVGTDLANELQYVLPAQGDFTVSVTISDGPSSSGLAAGVILHIDNKYVALERAFESGNVINAIENGKTLKSTTDIRVGEKKSGYIVSITRNGDKITVSGGYHVKMLTDYYTGTVPADAVLILGMYGTSGKDVNEAVFEFCKMNLNGEEIKFAEEGAVPDVKPSPTPTPSSSDTDAPSSSKTSEKEPGDQNKSGDAWVITLVVVAVVAVAAVAVGAVVFVMKKKKK